MSIIDDPNAMPGDDPLSGGYAEIRNGDTWSLVKGRDANDPERYWDVFYLASINWEVLAIYGAIVRCSVTPPGVEPAAECRGFPSDMSDALREIVPSGSDGPDVYFSSWLSLRELVAHDWSSWNSGGGQGEIERLIEYLNSLGATPEDTRIVVWVECSRRESR